MIRCLTVSVVEDDAVFDQMGGDAVDVADVVGCESLGDGTVEEELALVEEEYVVAEL